MSIVKAKSGSTALRKGASWTISLRGAEEVVLFGSHAYGQPDEGSDVDLLVIMPFHGKAPRLAAEMMTRLRPGFPVDILVRDRQTVQGRLALGDPFMREVMDRGKVLYAAS